MWYSCDIFSKAFDCLYHELNVYSCDLKSMLLIQQYLRVNRKRVAMYTVQGNNFFGAHQGSILGLFIFNIFMYDLSLGWLTLSQLC